MNETNSGRFGDWAKWSRSPCDTESELLSESELRRREHENLLATLHKTRWKIKSADGAAELLKIKLTTLVAHLRRMGIKRPALE
jgi:transcriptional regulator of acetoin/glycerol metabolism